MSVSKFQFFGPEQEISLRRALAGFHIALVGPPSTGKTHTMLHIRDKMCGDTAIAGKDYELVVGLPTITSDELIGGWTKDDQNNLVWYWGPVSRAMINGTPLFINEFTRLSRKAQNTLVAPLSEGYLPCPYLPGDQQYITAKKGFVVIMDMNTSEHDQSVEDLVWALGTRVRKVEFKNPDSATLKKILTSRGIRKGLIGPIATMWDQVNALYTSAQIAHPLTVRGVLAQVEDFELEFDGGNGLKAPEAFIRSAHTTWFSDVAGKSDQRKQLVDQQVDAVARTLIHGFASADEADREVNRVRSLLLSEPFWRKGIGPTLVENIINHCNVRDVVDLARLSDRDLAEVSRIGSKLPIVLDICRELDQGTYRGRLAKFLFGEGPWSEHDHDPHLFFKSLDECPECSVHQKVSEYKQQSPNTWAKLLEAELPI